VSTLTSHTCKLTEVQAEQLRALLDARNFIFRQVPFAAFSAANKDVNATFYNSGKLVVQGKGTREFIEFVLEPEIVGQAKLGYEALLDPELFLPRIGVDESGKGDFFGPLCVAGVYVNETVIKAWETIGIRDSKAIGSDHKIRHLAKIIRETPGCVTTVVSIGNEAYNRLYLKSRSVNALLAWGHARVIENLLGQIHRMIPPPVRAISDQFASSKTTVEKALMPLGRNLELVQRHKAEADTAVAAASILAREEFIRRLVMLGTKINMELPRGASTAVEALARKIYAERGENGLGSVAKMHFRTSYRVRGLPEPPVKKWNS
jgi:ribonuclease HIII